MTIDISDNAARASYTVNAGATVTSFTVPFEFFDDGDLEVYVDGTKKTISTHYTVSGGSGSTGTVSLSVTGASGGSSVVIVRSTVIERTSDFSSGADINRAALNTQLDTLTAIAADNRDRVTRTMSVPDSEVTPVLVLPSVANRKGKLLGFNSSSGNVEAGPVLSEVVTLAAMSANITSVAGKATEIGRLGTADAVSDMNVLGTADFVSDLNTLAAISGNITTVAGVASAVSSAPANATAAANSATAAASSASGASSSATAAASSAAAAAASFDSFDDRYLGSKSSEPSVDNDGNSLVEGALYFNGSSNSMQVFDGSDFIAASSAGTASLILYEYTASNNQTTFSGNDTNSATLSYTVLNIQVVVNGAILDPSDYTATSGTSVVLAAGAALNDVVNIYAFKSFTVSDTVSASSGGTFAANVTVNGNIVVSGTVDGRDVASDGALAATAVQPNDSATLNGLIVNGTLDIEEVYEKVTTATSTTGTITFDTTAQAVEFYTADQTANRTINFSNVNANLATGQSLSVAVLLTNGATPYYLNVYQVDAGAVTPKWQGASAPSAGNASGIDSYNFTIIKTADATFTVLASLTQFA